LTVLFLKYGDAESRNRMKKTASEFREWNIRNLDSQPGAKKNGPTLSVDPFRAPREAAIWR